MKTLKILLIIQTILVSLNFVLGIIEGGYPLAMFFMNVTLLGINYFLYRASK